MSDIMGGVVLFDKTYNGESIVDFDRDVEEAMDGFHNPLIASIPSDEHGFAKGHFKVQIVWTAAEDD